MARAVWQAEAPSLDQVKPLGQQVAEPDAAAVITQPTCVSMLLQHHIAGHAAQAVMLLAGAMSLLPFVCSGYSAARQTDVAVPCTLARHWPQDETGKAA